MRALRVLTAVLAFHSLARAAAPQTLTLSQAGAELDEKNLTLGQARARAAEAQGLVRQSLAALLPTLSAGGSYVRNNASATLALGSILDSIEGGLSKVAHTQVTLDRTNVPSDRIIQPLEAWTGTAALRVPLFAANGYADYLGAKQAAHASELSVEAARQNLHGALEQAALYAQSAEDIAAASERALTVAEEHAKSAERQVQAGTAAPLTRLQAQTEVVRRQSELARARAEQERAWLTIGVLLGRAEPVRVTMDAPRAVQGEEDAQLTLALEQRQELKVQAASLDAAEYQVASAWWRLAPTLSASGSATVSDIAFVTGQKEAWRLSVDLTWVLFDGGFRYGKRQQAEAQLENVRLASAAQRLEVRQQVLDARRDVSVAAERLTLAQKQLALAEETAASANRSFEAGLASSLDVIDANDRLYQAEVALADAKARVGIAGVALARATGSLSN